MIKNKRISFALVMSLAMLVFSCFALSIPKFQAHADYGYSQEYLKFEKDLFEIEKNRDVQEISNKDYYIKDDNVYVKDDIVDLYALDKQGDSSDGYSLVSGQISFSGDKAVLDNISNGNVLIVVDDGKVENFGAQNVAEYQEFHIFQYEDSYKMQNAFRQLSDLGVVVSYNHKISAHDEPIEEDELIEADALFEYNSWGADFVGYSSYTENMMKLYKQTDLKEIVVAVFDSGINSKHELFKGRIHNMGANFTNERSSTGYAYEDNYGHGSHVSGIIADLTLSNVKILPLKVLDKNGDGEIPFIIKAVAYVRENKSNIPNLKIANMSIGVEKSSDSSSAIDDSLMAAVQSLYDDGILPVVSAGNDKINTENACPANVYDAITVSAVAYNYFTDDVEFDSSYSNFGSHVDFAAPGTYIYSAGKSSPTAYVRMSGTSMAAPHVAAAIALLYSNPSFENYSFDDIELLLQNNAIDYGTKGKDDYYGYGLINIERIGVPANGYVSIVNVSNDPSQAEIVLSYSNIPNSQRAEIYYTLSEDAVIVDKYDIKYERPIYLSQTTKVSAVAYIYDSYNQLVGMSFINSEVFYFNNMDLYSNFEFENDDFSGIVTHYNGPLEELNMKNMIIKGIGAEAFSGSNVRVLHLPSQLKSIASRAFFRNRTLQEIDCDSTELNVGDRAFYECENLKTFKMPNVMSIGELAFAYDENLKELELPFINKLGKNALSGSGVRKLKVGQYAEIDEHRLDENSLTDIYGYTSKNVDEFAMRHGVKFHDMTIKLLNQDNLITRTINIDFESIEMPVKRIVEKEGEPIILSATCNFQGSNAGAYLDGNLIVNGVKAVNDLQTTLTVTLNNLSRDIEHEIYFKFTDIFNNSVTSQVSTIKIIDSASEQLSVTLNGDNYELYVDGGIYKGQPLYKGQNYDFEIRPINGYRINAFSVNDVEHNENNFKINQTDDEIVIDADVEALEMLSIDVEGLQACDFLVKKGEELVKQTEHFEVSNGKSLDFKIQEKEGYEIQSVMVDGVDILPQEDGFYHIESVTQNILIQIIFVKVTYSINVVLGRGGNVSATGTNQLEYGQSRTFVISPNKGYIIDYVSIDGQRIKVTNNTFVVSNVQSDKEVIIAFKETTSMFSGTMLIYLVIFAISIFAFIIASVVLYLIRKKQKVDIVIKNR